MNLLIMVTPFQKRFYYPYIYRVYRGKSKGILLIQARREVEVGIGDGQILPYDKSAEIGEIVLLQLSGKGELLNFQR